MKFKKEELQLIEKLTKAKSKSTGMLMLKATNHDGKVTHKTCISCRDFKPIEDYYKTGNYNDSLCRDCRLVDKRKK